MTNIIESRLNAINKILQKAPCPPTLVAVSKYQSVKKITLAIEAGQRVFGENKIQESLIKWIRLKEQYTDIKLHFIGNLQTNKVKEAVELFDVIESVDRMKLTKSLLKHMKALNRYPECFVQVNVGEEPQKSGVMPCDAEAFIDECLAMGLPVTGVMAIPPAEKAPTLYFKYLKGLSDKKQLKHTSMGMSRDYETAIECGATHIRLGTAIFGKRE